MESLKQFYEIVSDILHHTVVLNAKLYNDFVGIALETKLNGKQIWF